MTVAELLTGTKRPLSQREFQKWLAYLKVKARLQEQQAKKH